MGQGLWFLMAVHCHQPVGNFGFVFEEAYRKAYQPFLELLERHPTVCLTLHYSGSLLDWLFRHHPEFISRLKRLIERGQVELLSSGYYEPVLSIIPEADRREQIALTNATLHTRLGTHPKGLWLTERVWEPDLASTLASCGIRYTLLDTNQFRFSQHLIPSRLQVEDEGYWDLLGCYTTDHAGQSVVLFPASKRLRYWMPFQEVDRTITFLRRLAREEPVAVTFADDGEKFGLWPKTYEWVYDKGWLARFFQALEREGSWLKTARLTEYLESVGPHGRVYLPCGSYEEMLEWSGGYFKNFFIKYPEANAMHKRMLSVSHRLHEVEGSELRVRSSKTLRSKKRGHSSPVTPARLAREPGRARHSSLLQHAKRELYMAQGNDAYWHGVFGGLYLTHLRRTVWRHLIAAERALHRVRPLSPVETDDFDQDGRQELFVRTPHLGVLVDPAEGGTVTEVDVYGATANLVDTLARRYESYHEKLKRPQPVSYTSPPANAPASIHDLLGVKEGNLAEYLAYDDHRRVCFLDYALEAMPTLQDVMRSTWGERRLWDAEAFTTSTRPRTASSMTTVELSRSLGSGCCVKAVRVSRRNPVIDFDYRLEQVRVPVVALEFNLSLRDERLLKPAQEEVVRQLRVCDPELGLRVLVTCDPPARLLRFPVETVSESEEGLERTYQGLGLVCLWAVGERSPWSARVRWTVET